MVDLEAKIDQFIREHELETTVENRLLDLLSETGELAVVWQGTSYGKELFKVSEAWRDEFGDVLFAVFTLTQQTDTRVEDTLLGTLEKYERRLAASGNAGSES